MRLLYGLVGLLIIGLVSCEKQGDIEKLEKEHLWFCEVYVECNDTRFEDPYQNSENVEIYIIDPLVVSEECNCIVKGIVKYVENGKTAAMVYYGDGKCGNSVKKVFCVNGDCKSKNIEVCYFDQANCNVALQTQKK